MRMAGDAGECVAQVGEGLNVMALAGGNQAEQDRGGAAAGVAARKEETFWFSARGRSPPKK
jgi:hypothetical protein